MNRYYRITSDTVYEQARLALDAAFGHPQVRAETCIDPAAVAPRDTQGNILLAVREEWLSWEAVAAMLPQLLASGVVAEITERDFFDSQPPHPAPF